MFACVSVIWYILFSFLNSFSRIYLRVLMLLGTLFDADFLWGVYDLIFSFGVYDLNFWGAQ
jgi:hypothetical protein